MRTWSLFGALLLLAACERHKWPEASHVTQSDNPSDVAPRIQAGPAAPEAKAFRSRSLPINNPFEGDAKAIQEGRRLYRWMNCLGCHAEGGGSIGPTLWDDQWRYGGRGIDIAESILYGRPDGMPAFAGHLPMDQVWRIVAYVQSMEPRGGPYHQGVK
jgi:cytochrome c oxidase cbb3-type subunit 3